MRHSIPDLTYDEIETAINQRIVGKHSARDRDIMRKRLLEGLTFEEIAEAVGLSVRQVYNVVYRCEDRLFR
jgi:DNA-directed RNA polymerase specialized sigma24 family protein